MDDIQQEKTGVKHDEFNVVEFSVKLDFKTIKHIIHPEFLTNEDAVRQYYGIWKIIAMFMKSFKAKKVLEFGTREGYSTQLFSHLLRFEEGHLWTVDLAEPKIEPAIKEKLDNVTFIQMDILNLDTIWKEYVDILYIDDWHNPYHLYQELDRYARFARLIMIHDVVQNWQTHEWLLPAIFSWCLKENLPFYTYPLNCCGLVVIPREEFQNFYEYES